MLPTSKLLTGQYGCQMGTKLKVVLCDEHGIGGSSEYLGDNDAHLDIIYVFYHEASVSLQMGSIN